MKGLIRRALTVIALSAFLPAAASATTLFFEDFEGDLSQWGPNYSGVIVNDPLDGGNKALAFRLLKGGGDIFSQWINNPTGSYILSFDYLGRCDTDNCGGFIKTEFLPWQGTTAPYPDTLPDTRQWVHLEFAYTGGIHDRIIIEDWIGSYGRAGDVFFDNIELTDAGGSTRSVPEPATLTLFGLGLMGLGLKGRKKKS